MKHNVRFTRNKWCPCD